MGGGGGYENLEGFLESEKSDVEGVRGGYMKGWEGMSEDGRVGLGEEKGEEWFSYIWEEGKDCGIRGWIVGNGYLCDWEGLKKGVMVYG